MKPYEIAQTIPLTGMLDRRRRLSDKDKEQIRELYSKGTMSWNSLAKLFHVSKSLIGMIVNPQRAEAARQRIKDHWREYYSRRSKAELAATARKTKNYKYRLYKKGLIKETTMDKNKEPRLWKSDVNTVCSSQEEHDNLLKAFVDEKFKGDVEVDWEYSGAGKYRFQAWLDRTEGIPLVSLKWEGA